MSPNFSTLLSTLSENHVRKSCPEIMSENHVRKSSPEIISENHLRKSSPKILSENPLRKSSPENLSEKPLRETSPGNLSGKSIRKTSHPGEPERRHPGEPGRPLRRVQPRADHHSSSFVSEEEIVLFGGRDRPVGGRSCRSCRFAEGGRSCRRNCIFMFVRIELHFMWGCCVLLRNRAMFV